MNRLDDKIRNSIERMISVMKLNNYNANMLLKLNERIESTFMDIEGSDHPKHLLFLEMFENLVDNLLSGNRYASNLILRSMIENLAIQAEIGLDEKNKHKEIKTLTSKIKPVSFQKNYGKTISALIKEHLNENVYNVYSILSCDAHSDYRYNVNISHFEKVILGCWVLQNYFELHNASKYIGHLIEVINPLTIMNTIGTAYIDESSVIGAGIFNPNGFPPLMNYLDGKKTTKK